MRAPGIALVAVAGCGAAHGTVDTPAYIARATPESRAAVAQAVARALSGTHVALDDDALTRDGVLVIERGQRRDPTRLVAQGRDPDDPGTTERFHLVKIDEHCVLVHDRTGVHYDLVGTSCLPR